MVPLHGPCHLDTLFQESEKVGRELTREFYAEYAFIRRSTPLDAAAGEPRGRAHASSWAVPRSCSTGSCSSPSARIAALLPAETIKRAYAHRDPYNPRPLWDNFRGLFRAINVGNDELDIRKYNGGLFADDPVLDNLKVPDEVFGLFRDLAEYDFRPASAIAEDEAITDAQLIDVEILGHIFEQSIDDLEKLQAELDKPVEILEAPEVEQSKEKVSRRKHEGAFYTPAFITRYIVEQALGGVLRDRFERLRRAHAEKAKGTARNALADPTAYDLDSLKAPQREALLAFWLDWQEELGSIRILDPACGSGAFLIEAFDQLHTVYEQTNDRVEELRGNRRALRPGPQDPPAQPLRRGPQRRGRPNRQAQPLDQDRGKGKDLTSLDHTIRVGNSIVADPAGRPQGLRLAGRLPRSLQPRQGTAASTSWSATRPTSGRNGSRRSSRTCNPDTRPSTAWPTSTSTSTSWA